VLDIHVLKRMMPWATPRRHERRRFLTATFMIKESIYDNSLLNMDRAIFTPAFNVASMYQIEQCGTKKVLTHQEMP
jgi:hypothetical protein